MRSKLTTAAILAVVSLLVIAGTGTPTVASFGDTEAISATFQTGDEQALTTESTTLEVTTQNGQDTRQWRQGVSYGPSTYNTSVLVVTGGDGELRLEIESDATEPLRFRIASALLKDEFGVTDLRGMTATLDGAPLSVRTTGSGDSEHVEFTIDHFSTRYVTFVAPEEPVEPQSGTDEPQPDTDDPAGTDEPQPDTDDPAGPGTNNGNGGDNKPPQAGKK